MINVILVIFFERSVSHLKLALFHSFNGMLQFFKKMYSLRKKWLKILNLINKVDEAGRENKYKILFLNDFSVFFRQIVILPNMNPFADLIVEHAKLPSLNTIDSKWLDSNRVSFRVGGDSFTN